MRYIFFVYLLLGLASTFMMAQPLTLVQANRLRLTLTNSRLDTQQVHTRLRLGVFYLNKTLDAKRSLDSALIMTQQAQTLSRQLGYSSGAEEAVFLQGRVYIRQRKTDLVVRMLNSVSDTNHIRLLLELGKDWLRSTLTRDANLSKARNYFGRAQALSQRLHSQRWQEESQQLIGMSYALAEDWPASKAYFMRVIQARQQAGDREGELWVWLKWSTASQCDDCQKHIAFACQALARQLGDKPKQAVLLILIGYHYLGLQNLKQAEQEANQALAMYKIIGSKSFYQTYARLAAESDFIHRTYLIDFSTPYYLFNRLHFGKRNIDQSLRYILKIIEEAERSGLPNDLDYLYFMVGNLYYEWNQYEKSVEYYQQSLVVSQQKGEVVINIGMIRRLVACLLKLGKVQPALTLLKHVVSQDPPYYGNKSSLYRSFGDCYSALKQYRLAEAYYLQALRRTSVESIKWGRNLAWLQLSEFYVNTGQLAKANLYLVRLANQTDGVYSARDKQTIILLQFKVDSAFGHHTSALRHYQRYTTFKDSIFNQTKSKQIAELGVRYETHKKEQDLLLKAKNIALLTQQSQTQQSQRNTLLAGTILLAALLGLSYNRYQLKQRSNRLLQDQQRQLHAQHRALQAQQVEISHTNDDLQRLLAEKELLLKEIHHRVKNNLQTVISLLNLQASYLADNAALSAIQQSQHRVQAMALIHQKLYRAEGMVRIEMAFYIEEVVAYLQESFNLPLLIRFEQQVDPIELDVTQAVPLGLIINEAITNALKYAFPAGRTGTVQVGLRRLNAAGYELVIADDGVGLPVDFDPAKSRSLGMTLIQGFSKQLGGQLQISGQSGLGIRLLFPEGVNTVNL